MKRVRNRKNVFVPNLLLFITAFLDRSWTAFVCVILMMRVALIRIELLEIDYFYSWKKD